MYELPQNVPVHGTNPCGRIDIPNIAINIVMRGMKHLPHLDFGKSWSLSTSTLFVH
jgi:hypothetical protein